MVHLIDTVHTEFGVLPTLDITLTYFPNPRKLLGYLLLARTHTTVSITADNIIVLVFLS